MDALDRLFQQNPIFWIPLFHGFIFQRKQHFPTMRYFRSNTHNGTRMLSRIVNRTYRHLPHKEILFGMQFIFIQEYSVGCKHIRCQICPFLKGRQHFYLRRQDITGRQFVKAVMRYFRKPYFGPEIKSLRVIIKSVGMKASHSTYDTA